MFIIIYYVCLINTLQVRVIRDSSPNKYMAILQFNDQASVDEFYLAFNGRRYNSLEPETCHVLYIAEVGTVSYLQIKFY